MAGRYTFAVTDSFGTVHTICADSCYGAEAALIMERKDEKGEAKVVAHFAPGHWSSFVVMADAADG